MGVRPKPLLQQVDGRHAGQQPTLKLLPKLGVARIAQLGREANDRGVADVGATADVGDGQKGHVVGRFEQQTGNPLLAWAEAVEGHA